MKKETWICDCCGKEEPGEMMSLRLPIRDLNSRGFSSSFLTPEEMDLCFECAKVISDTYYERAKEKGWSGLKKIKRI